MSTLAGLSMSNIGLISPNALEYAIVNKYLLTMAVPLLLFSADLRYTTAIHKSDRLLLEQLSKLTAAQHHSNITVHNCYRH